MSESEAPRVLSAPEPSEAAPAPRHRDRAWLVAGIAAALLVATYLAWHFLWLARQREAQDEQQQLALRVEAVARSAEQAHHEADTLRARLDDESKVNQSLREQLLALTERARLVEDSVANLADKRLSGHDSLQLGEAEMLLALGAERFTLFHDTPAAIEAYRLADTALAAVDDAAFSTVRQSISAETQELDALGSADAAATLAALTAMRSAIGALPAATPGLPTADGDESSWTRWLGRFVRVHRGGDAAALAQHHEIGLARQLLALDLRDAEAALLARDEKRYQSTLADAQNLLGADFDPQADAVKAAHAALVDLARARLAPPPPPILGSALKELRNLRSTHSLRSAPQVVPEPKSGQESS